ncbi:MAG: hypothetical protein Fur0041_08550 [Bacteroidia bacterium]
MKLTNRLLLLMLCLWGGSAVAQMSWYYVPKKNNEKYFVSASYGIGTARWYSEMQQTSLYDNQGSTIHDGNFKFRAANSSSVYDLHVLFPSGNVRFGLGLNFEKFYLTTIQLQNTLQTVNTGSMLLFDETFRFDKLYFITEVPFWPESRSKWSLAANMYGGFFSFNNVDRINLFGSDALATSVFTGISAVGDFQVFPGVHLFVRPMAEYKFFKNPAVDPFGTVTHNIVTYTAMIGIRYDPSVIDDLK